MTEIKYSDLEKLIENEIRQWARSNDITDYDEEYSDFSYVDGLALASNIATLIYLKQGGDGVKIV